MEIARGDEASQFLRQEIQPWAGIFLHAVDKNAQEDFYRVLARETRELLFNDAASESLRALPNAFDSPELVDLETVVAQLIIPSRSGIFLSKEDISTIARKLDLPISFGDRALMLKSLFRSAGEFDRIQSLLHALQAETDNWVERFAADAREHPSCAQITQDWLNRAGATLAKLRNMQQAVTTDGN